MNTNRDLYRFVTGLCERRSADQVPSLEVYLRSLWFVGRTWDDDIIPIGTLGEWLRSAFSSSPPDFDDAWHSIAFPAEEPGDDPRDLWEKFILFQIADLRRMAEAGTLDNEHRYFGVDSPAGIRWYNFDPCSYLECGVRGSVGGYIENEVIILDRPDDGGSADSPVVPLGSLTWDEFRDLLWCGMSYE